MIQNWKVKQQSIQLGETAAVLAQFLLEKESTVKIQDLRNINVEQIKYFSDHYLEMLQSEESKSGIRYLPKRVKLSLAVFGLLDMVRRNCFR